MRRELAAITFTHTNPHRRMNRYVPIFSFCGLHDPQLHGYTVEYQAWATFLGGLLYT